MRKFIVCMCVRTKHARKGSSNFKLSDSWENLVCVCVSEDKTRKKNKTQTVTLKILIKYFEKRKFT